MEVTPEHDALFSLLSQWVEGELSESETAELDAWLQRDENARAIYVHYMAMELDVKEHADLEAAAPLAFEADMVCRPTKQFSRWRYAAVAVVVLAAGVIIGRGTDNSSAPANAKIVSDNANPELDEGVAILTEIIDDALTNAFSEGTVLQPGKLQVKSGYVRVEFYRGAAAIIKGPADVELTSDNSMKLEHGIVHAHVPPEATGFTIGTPYGQIIDRGTAFGVVVDEKLGMKTRVYTGKVELLRPNSSETILVKELEGMQITPEGNVIHWDGSDDPVISGKALQEMVQSRRQVQFSRRHNRLNTLRDDPATALLYSGLGMDPWSRKITNQVSTKRATDGVLVGCRTVEGRFLGERAISFGGLADRVRFEMTGEYPALTVAGWFRLEGLPNKYSSLVMADGFDPNEFHWQINENGKIRIGIQTEDRKMGVNYESTFVVTEERFGHWLHLAFTYDLATKTVRHFVDGEVVSESPIALEVPIQLGKAEIGNWLATPGDVIKPFRGFHGSLDQLLISSRAFSSEEITTIYHDEQLD